MNRPTMLSSPFLLGFDRLEKLLDRAAKSADDGYPPYNIEQVGETAWRIVLAVAGFGADDLSVTVEENQLVIAGRKPQDPERAYLYRGIAARQFQRRFVLADGVEITGASAENGLLSIELNQPRVEPEVRKISIESRT